MGGRQRLPEKPYDKLHLIIVSGTNPLTRLLIRAEHIRLLHAGPTSTAASLAHRYHLLGRRAAFWSVVCGCITCRRITGKPRPQILGQLLVAHLNPVVVFNDVSIDYAGPIMIKAGYVRKPVLTKAFVCLCVLQGEGS